jgi:hypothetical protein
MDTLTRTPSPVPLAAARDAARFGAKAAGQARLAACGLAVPGGVVVGDDVRRAYLARRGLDELDAAGLCAAALPADLLQALLAACAPLARPLIVRSSGLGEDSAAASFAGLLESIGGVTSDAALERALRACWAARGAQRGSPDSRCSCRRRCGRRSPACSSRATRRDRTRGARSSSTWTVRGRRWSPAA